MMQSKQPTDNDLFEEQDEQRRILLELGMPLSEVEFIFALERGETQGDVMILPESPSSERPAAEQPASGQKAA